MPNYRRLWSKGASYFFTVNLADRRGRLLVEHVDVLRDAVRQTRAERPFKVDAMVVLPDHLHAVWTLPEGDADFSTRWGAIKGRFTRAVGRVGFQPTGGAGNGGGVVGWNPTLRSRSKVMRQEGKVWQRRFWEHCIRDEADYRAHVEYCWINPVKHGYVVRAAEWPYSSIHRDIARGVVGAEHVGWVVPDGKAGGVHPPTGERGEAVFDWRRGG
ncbi:putative transposase [Litoreibacter halocynthiae]|uniref:Putative transposase n=1 Tax=Litoreibacter halocynthiae TaxID=1242689 RepID=A0A4R7LR56_9RHOB|nr:transposase [Litoreibacter halocynthiae]TDT77292.1 putative transposase [Litoreibacter halocynthiae]